jgi:uncharacterized membrane protein (UPF0127 family)
MQPQVSDGFSGAGAPAGPGRHRPGRHAQPLDKHGKGVRGERWLAAALVVVAAACFAYIQLKPESRQRQAVPGFDEITATITDGDGSHRRVCLLLAETPDQQIRGLNGLTDPDLGGYDGMAFRNASDVDVPLRAPAAPWPVAVTFLGVDGHVIATTTMPPCAKTGVRCPHRSPGRLYRSAIEVPQQRMASLGIDDDVTVTFGARACTS